MILGISKSAAYELANSWLATEGQAGLPAVRVRRCILVPRAALDRLAAVGSDHDNIGFTRRLSQRLSAPHHRRRSLER